MSSYTGYHFLEAVFLVATVEGLTGIVFRIEVVFRVVVQPWIYVSTLWVGALSNVILQ